ncbi:MAG TPA: phosphopantetheine-binding protein [Coleofasciculaceae cyanobacterium]
MMDTHKTQTKEITVNILRTIAPEADFDALGDDENIRQALGIDSFDFLNFMIGINDSFGVEIPETDYGKLMTLDDVIDYIESHAR